MDIAEFDRTTKELGGIVDALASADFDALSALDNTPTDAALRADMLLSAAGALQVIAYHAVAVSLGFVKFMSDQLAAAQPVPSDFPDITGVTAPADGVA